MKIGYLFAIGVCLSTALLGGCKRNFDITAKNAITSLSQIPATDIRTETLKLADSATNGKVSALVEISLEYPVSGNFFAVNSIFEWMSEQMGGTYSNPNCDPKEMLAFYSKSYMDDMKEFLMEGEEREYTAYKEVSFAKNCETDKFITYICEGAEYSGGAHGSAAYFGQTFRKSDGRRITGDIFLADKLPELINLITAGLDEQYFGPEHSLDEALLDDVAFLPMPATPPFFTENGVKFVYQQYEIAPYAAGIPQCLIPYDRIEPLLTQTGRALLSNKTLVEAQ